MDEAIRQLEICERYDRQGFQKGQALHWQNCHIFSDHMREESAFDFPRFAHHTDTVAQGFPTSYLRARDNVGALDRGDAS